MLRKRGVIKASETVISVLLVIGIIVGINILSMRWIHRIDMTAEKIYTLSPETKKMLSQIDDVVSVNVYFSENLPPNLLPVKEAVKDILNDFGAYSHEKLAVKFIDPKGNEELERKLMRIGIPQIEMNILQEDRQEVVLGYLGIGIFYEDKVSVIPVVTSTENLEYELARSIKKVITRETPTIAFITGHGEPVLSDTYTTIRQELEKQYNVEYLDTSRNPDIPERVKTVIIIGPEKDYTDRELYELDQFLMRGGKLIFLGERVHVGNNLRAKPVDSNIFELISNYGIDVNKDLVVDLRSHTYASFGTQFARFISPYPFWVKVLGNRVNKRNPVLYRIQFLVFPWASSIELSSDEGIRFEKLFATTNLSYSKTFPFDLGPQQDFHQGGNMNSKILGVVLSGRLPSYFKTRDIPDYEGNDDRLKEFFKQRDEYRKKITQSIETQIVVVSDSDFISDNFISRNTQNMEFFLNLVDYLSLDDSLIKIRAKTITRKPLKEIDDNEKQHIKLYATFFSPALLTAVAIIKSLYRRRRLSAFLRAIESEKDARG